MVVLVIVGAAVIVVSTMRAVVVFITFLVQRVVFIFHVGKWLLLTKLHWIWLEAIEWFVIKKASFFCN